MGKRLSIRQGTAWYFMQKVRKAMKSSQKYPLEKIIHVDEQGELILFLSKLLQ